MFRVNKQKCVGCQACLQNCPGSTKIGTDGKAEIIDQEKLEKCGEEKVCPLGAIEKVSNGEEKLEPKTSPSPPSYRPFPGPSPYGSPPGGKGLGMGGSRGMGVGRGGGLGRGPRDGRGGGHGGGGRRN